uniref:Uncharacterized protein n=1 Tax=Denticeps clupeoides TaxID=299321 RepID=A0AAY4B207_9TELE
MSFLTYLANESDSLLLNRLLKQSASEVSLSHNANYTLSETHLFDALVLQAIFENMGKKFWDADPSLWDAINNTGLSRGHYFCSVYAARLMVSQGHELIVVILSLGRLHYFFNVPYGVGKAATHATELRSRGVAPLSLWPGAVQTELCHQHVSSPDAETVVLYSDIFESGETTEFSGKCIIKLSKDMMSMTGQVLMTCDLWVRHLPMNVLCPLPVLPLFIGLPRFILSSN